jgi:parvulin-like peptidyl-prolyl isomerase
MLEKGFLAVIGASFMSKRQQTTALPKKGRKVEAESPADVSRIDKLLGNPRTRQERDEALARLIVRGVIIVVLVLALIIAIALIYQLAIVPSQSVATVNGQTISVAEFRDRFRFERSLTLYQAQVRASQIEQQASAFGMDPNQMYQQDQQLQEWSRELQFPDALGQRVLDEMIDELLVQQEAADRSIAVDSAQVDDQINGFFGYDPTQVALIGTPATETPVPTITPTPFVSPTPTNTPAPTQTPTPEAEATAESTAEATAEVTAAATIPPSPTPSQEDIQNTFEQTVDLFRQTIRGTDVSDASIDAFFERQTLRTAVAEALAGEVTSGIFVNARHILVATEEEAATIIASLQAGESFSELARARSTDTGSGSRGGELGWSVAAGYVPEFEAAVIEAEIGAIVGPVQTEFGYHIIQVIAREERELDEADRERVRASTFSEWLDGKRAEADIQTNSDWPNYLPD